MTSPVPLLIHIGCAKAGSTWLQKHLLGNQAFGLQMPVESSALRIQFQNVPAFEFDAYACREFFRPQLSEPASGCVQVLSCEGLTGSSRIGDFQRKEIADRLFDVFPQARIFLVFREQRSMQLAQYHQYLRRGGVYSLKNFLNPPMKDRRKLPYFDWNRFRYHHLLSYYQRLFGRENVLALPLEMLEQQPKSFLKRLADFCGLAADDSVMAEIPTAQRQRPSQSSLVMNLRRPLSFVFGEQTSFNPRSVWPLSSSRRRFNAWAESIDRWLPDAVKRRHRLHAERTVAAAVGDYYAESNRQLCELTGLNLEEFGYSVAADGAVTLPLPSTVVPGQQAASTSRDAA